MISKNGCDWFHQVLTCFALKMWFFCKMIKWDELCDFHDFIVFSRWIAKVYLTVLICSLGEYLVEALDLVDLVLLNQLHYKSFVNGFKWLIEWYVDDCGQLNIMLLWNDVLFHFTWFMKSIWNCYDMWSFMLMCVTITLMWIVLLNVWTCILDNTIVVEIANVIGGVLLHCRCYVEVVHYQVIVVCPCIMIILSHMWKCKRGGVLLHRWFVREEVYSYIWCFCCIMGDDLEEIWYHMHICVESRHIAYWNHVLLWHVNDVLLVMNVFNEC
jgi:hypothetical protein